MNMYESMPTTVPDRVPVVAGLLLDAKKRVLIGRRTAPDQYFGKWEFPGGKIEQDETVSEALCRELNEELGISVINSSSFDSFSYDYPDRRVKLIFELVEQYEGEPKSLEQQELRWVKIAELSSFDMLAPNVRVIEQLKQLEQEA